MYNGNSYKFDGTYFICDMAIMCNKNLTMTSKILLNYMCGFWDNGLLFFASNKACSEMLGVSVRSINNAIKELKDKNYIHCEYRKDEQSNVVRVITKYQKIKRDKSKLEETFNEIYEKIKSFRG